MKKRIISAIIMIGLFIPFLLLGGIYYTILGCILGMMSLWELFNLKKEIPFVIKIISYAICLFLILYQYNNYSFLGNDAFLILLAMFLIYSISVIINEDLTKYNYKDMVWLISIVLLVSMMFNSFIRLRIMGLEHVLYCVIISTMTDTFALFGGKLFGKHKLSRLSPHKTIEGSVIGSLFGTILGSVYYYLVIGTSNIGIIFLITFLLSILGQFGDLFFSSIKRVHDIKDFSNLIPGHGGVLDRLDSVMFVILGYLLYTMII